MAVTSNEKTELELDKEAAKDVVSSYIRLKGRDWFRRQMNAVWPEVNRQIDQAVAEGDRIDVAELVKQVFFDQQLRIGTEE